MSPIAKLEPAPFDESKMLLNMGPQHPSTHGVLRVKLVLDGEVCIKAVPYLGYLHRGVEKLCEKLSYVQITPIVDKNDYVSPMMNEMAINMAFEKLVSAEVPRRARYIRTICAEIQRVGSHLLWLGTFGLDMGGAIGGGGSIFMHTFRERELLLDLFEDLTGCRFHYNTHTVGGNRHKLVCALQVSDDGPGVDKEMLPRLFLPMVTGNAQGTGLGLSIAQRIANQHGGLIQVQSVPGETCFTLLLPMETQDASD